MSKSWIVCVWLTLLLISSCALYAANGILVHYTFNEGSGSVVRDISGNGHDGKINGGASWVNNQGFKALSFNGTDAFIGGPTDLPIAEAGTLEIWSYPRRFGGGLISWHLSDSQRLSLKYDIYQSNNLIGYMVGGKAWGYIEVNDSPVDVVNRWSHLVMSFDKHDMRIFRNGKLKASKPSWPVPDIKGIPMRVGLGSPLGFPYFDGMIAEVRVYNRALSEGEIAAHFAEKAGVFQPHLPRTLAFVPRLRAADGKLIVEADLTDAGVSSGSVEAQLLSGSKLLQKVTKPVTSKEKTTSLSLKSRDLAIGEYEIKCIVRDEKGTAVVTSSRKWQMPKFAASKGIMNNLAAELLNVENIQVRNEKEFSFTNPRKGWVFISCDATLEGLDTLSVNADGALEGSAIRMSAGATSPGETMCFLPEGPGKLRIRTAGKPVVERLIVRSIPELMFCGYPGVPKIKGFGDFNYDFLKKQVLPNINTIVGNWGLKTFQFYVENGRGWTEDRLNGYNMLELWKNMGRRYLEEGNIPSVVSSTGRPTDWNWQTNPTTCDQAFDWWTRTDGLTQPEFAGFVADEWALCEGYGAPEDTHPYMDPRYRLPAYTEAIRRISADPKFKDRNLYMWCGGVDRALTSQARDFVETTLSVGGKIAEEHYLAEPLTEEDAHDLLYGEIRPHIDRVQSLFPDLMENLIFVPCIASAIPESENVDPRVDFKVWMDIQMRYLATAPEFFGLGGIMWYHISYADEEAVRWMGQLYRHYGIEGKKDLLSPAYGYNYKPGIVENPDFDEGLKGWITTEAEPGAVGTGNMHMLGRYQVRARRYEMGQNFLLMKRSAAGPNTVTQVIKNLTPGKVYSAKMMTSDYQAMLKDVASHPMNARLSIDGVEMIPEKCFVSEAQGPDGPYWFDYHRLVFRATGPTAKLTISDWGSDSAPVGPVGQEVMCNFIELQPYFE